MRNAWIVSWLLVCGCGEYVKLENATPVTPGSSSPDGGSTLPVGGDVPATETFDHSAFSALLGEYVSVDGDQSSMDYAALAANADDLAALDTYIAALAAQNPSALVDQDERLAFWLNAYNANVIRKVIRRLDQNPAASVSDDDFSFFRELDVTVGGQVMTLDYLEHWVVRDEPNRVGMATFAEVDTATLSLWAEQLWGGQTIDPRIHVAVNCAAQSCPNLQQQAWLAEGLDAQLQTALVAFLADPEKGAGPGGLSMLFTWFEPDWVAVAGSVEAYVTERREGGATDVDFAARLEYNWALNATP